MYYICIGDELFANLYRIGIFLYSIGFYISSDPREEYCNGLPAYIRCSTTGKRNFFCIPPPPQVNPIVSFKVLQNERKHI